MTATVNPFEALERRLDYIDAKLDLIARSPAPKEIGERWLTVRGASEHTGYSPHTVYKLKSENQIPFHQRGKKLLFLESELNDWLQSK